MVQAQLKPWRDACITALKSHSTADAVRAWGHAFKGPDGSAPIFDYRFEHTLAAVKIARWLAQKTGADLDILECAAWLHDCKKRLNEPHGQDTHAEEAAACVELVLTDTDFPRHKQNAVRHAILHHVGLTLSKRLEPLETACLWDADKLSKIGAASLTHFCCISGSFGPVDTQLILQRGERWLERAQEIADSMNTGPGREEANKRLTFLQGHYAQLRREWDDSMQETP